MKKLEYELTNVDEWKINAIQKIGLVFTNLGPYIFFLMKQMLCLLFKYLYSIY